MSAKGKIEKWLYAEWSTAEEPLPVVSPAEDHDGAKKELNVAGVTYEYHQPERLSNSKVHDSHDAAGTSAIQEDRDFSPSASSWEPSCSSSEESDESNEEQARSIKVERFARQYSNKKHNSKRILTPSHRVNAIIPNVLQPKQLNSSNKNNCSRKRKHIESNKEMTLKKFLPDSTRKNNTPTADMRVENINVNVREILDIKAGFRELFRMLNELKPASAQRKKVNDDVKRISPVINGHNKDNISDAEDGNSNGSRSDESNRSDDNVLITNKYAKARVPPVTSKGRHSTGTVESEWVPIGSGKTLIHKEKFRKVKWKSYTIATRTLLLATFPRKILATHSLTGKRSPAFQNKPPKMCLDPKIISDVIIEITSRFKVKENLVRSIITTKCADECKMYKMRMKLKPKNKNEPLEKGGE